MKQFDTLTKEELSILTQDEVSKYIDLACAERGIPLLPEMPEKPVEPTVSADITMYEVAGRVVPSMEWAEQIQAVFNRVVTYSRQYSKNCGNLYVYEPDERSWDDPSKIKTIHAMSAELYAQHRKEIELYNTSKKEYDRIFSLVSDIKKKREQTERYHLDSYQKAVEWAYERKQLKKQFSEYLKLSEGNCEIAWNFLVKANSDVDENYPGIRDELVGF